MNKKLLLSIPLIWLCFLSFALVSCTSAKELTTEYEETMYIYVFFAAPPGELRFSKNIWLIFENIRDGPPINTCIKALNDRFIALKFSFTSFGESFFVSFDIFYESTVDNETANSYADEIEEEFFRTMGHSGLESIFGGRVLIVAEEGEKKIIESFGFIPLTCETVSAFLGFAPKDGFGRFIDGVIQKYTPSGEILENIGLKNRL